jgi:glycosyltransferase involved in cell wall biosynthesis
MIEALACGTPVAAFPVAGPIDVLDENVGRMDEDLGEAIAGALGRDRAACVRHAQRFSWSASARQFVLALAPLDRASLVPRRTQVEVVA